jgi:NAD(P)-dependent dehydrogenase (short-subunit alcohol dehydrogenase family)
LSFVKLALASQVKVLIADIQLLKEAQDLIQSPALAGRVAYAKCDVCEWDQLERLPSEVVNAFGHGAVADVWVAGAGVFEPNAHASSFFLDNEDDHYRTMRINAEHPIKLTRIAMRSCLKANKPGVVLIVASGAGVTGFYGSPLYCATKHAVVGFTKSMAQAHKDENFKVVSVCPGIVATPMWNGDAAKEVAKQYAYSDEKSITPEEVAAAMKDLIEQGKFEGGSLLEISKTRGNNLLESSELGKTLGAEGQTWIDGCYAPVREILQKERVTGSGSS